VRGLCVAFVLAVALGGCDAPHAATPRLWTVADVQALYASGETAVAMEAGLPGGVKLEKILDPTDHTRLVPRRTIVEEYNGTYLTTEVWDHFDEVWLQPMYIPITGWGSDGPLVLGGPSSWIFSVGPDSRFYSPFWQMVYFKVDPGTPAITTVREVLDGKHSLQYGPGRTVSLVPDGLVPPDPIVAGAAAVATGTAWVDGQPTSFLDFGKATFTWNDDAVIDEVPIFIFLMHNAAGELVAPDIPTVAGTGPRGSGGPPPLVIGGQNRYVTYWRLYTVTLPASARVFDPTHRLKATLEDAGLPAVMTYSATAAGSPDLFGWVALNPGPDDSVGGCFASDALLEPHLNTNADRCIWLDSQAAIENSVDRSAIQRTDVTVTCPFVSFNGYDVSPIK
jgi:hypothetical protein